jgi:hypothetical protein
MPKLLKPTEKLWTKQDMVMRHNFFMDLKEKTPNEFLLFENPESRTLESAPK